MALKPSHFLKVVKVIKNCILLKIIQFEVCVYSPGELGGMWMTKLVEIYRGYLVLSITSLSIYIGLLW